MASRSSTLSQLQCVGRRRHLGRQGLCGGGHKSPTLASEGGACGGNRTQRQAPRRVQAKSRPCCAAVMDPAPTRSANAMATIGKCRGLALGPNVAWVFH